MIEYKGKTIMIDGLITNRISKEKLDIVIGMNETVLPSLLRRLNNSDCRVLSEDEYKTAINKGIDVSRSEVSDDAIEMVHVLSFLFDHITLSKSVIHIIDGHFSRRVDATNVDVMKKHVNELLKIKAVGADAVHRFFCNFNVVSLASEFLERTGEADIVKAVLSSHSSDDEVHHLLKELVEQQ